MRAYTTNTKNISCFEFNTGTYKAFLPLFRIELKSSLNSAKKTSMIAQHRGNLFGTNEGAVVFFLCSGIYIKIQCTRT